MIQHTWLILPLLVACLLHENVARQLPSSQKLHKVRSVNDLIGQRIAPACECPVVECPAIKCPVVECPVIDHSLNQSSKIEEKNNDVKTCPCSSVNHQRNSFASDGMSAFTVELSNDRSLSDSVPITFDQILSDPSDSFTPLLGMFTCPDDDTYAFYWTTQAVEGRVAAMLVKNGEDMKYGPLTSEIPGDTGGSSSMAAIMTCTAGTHVWLRAVTWPDNMACNRILKDYSSFSAFKLFRQGETDASGFTAQLSVNTSVSDNVIVFDEELIDLGNDYNPSTGEFKVPEAGIYVFTVSAHIQFSTTNTIRLRKNGSFVTYVPRVANTYDSSRDSGTSTMTRMLDCQKDDIITVYSPSSLRYLAGVTSFTGYRLHNPTDPQDLVAFHASRSASTDVIDGNTIEFNVATVNLGDYYFPSLGIFVCPDDSMYFLTWSVTLASENGNRAGEARLTMANEVKKTGPQTGRVLISSHSSTSSTQAVVQCEYQKAFAIRAVVSDSNPVRIYAPYSNFMGFRLPPI